MSKQTLRVGGMSCGHCEKAVQDALSDIGVKSVKASAKTNEVFIEFDEATLNLEKIKAEIVDTGYELL